MKEVLDTRFFIEHFYSSDPEVQRKTREKLRVLAKDGAGIVPAIVLMEVVSVTCEKRGEDEASIRYLSVLRSGLQVANITPEVAKVAGMLRCMHRKVPMGDCVTAAVAITSNAKVITDDPHFEDIESVKRAWL
ncbi:MAG: PIN domain-containing protein [Thaumarchaeota archaeon]|nr:PIN domain-containing protein [Nitrososphaerota archaeon]